MIVFEFDQVGRAVAQLQSSSVNVDLVAPEGQIVANRESGSVATVYFDLDDMFVKNKESPNFVFDKSTIVADGMDSATITNLPANTLVIWPDGLMTEINDGSIEFAVDMPGTYSFVIDSVQHLKQEVTIEALSSI